MRSNDLGFVYPPVGGGIGYVERISPNRRARRFSLRRFVRRLAMLLA
jgi:hypothetical protein